MPSSKHKAKTQKRPHEAESEPTELRRSKRKRHFDDDDDKPSHVPAKKAPKIPKFKSELMTDESHSATLKEEQQTESKKTKQDSKHETKCDVKMEVKVKSEAGLGKDSDMFVGAHVSAAGGAHKAVINAVNIGCRAFALFLKSQRKWEGKPLDEKVITLFKSLIKEHNFEPDMIVPHGSYLINCGSPNPETVTKSKAALVDELQRCEQLGLTMYNFHPGSSCGKQSVEHTIKLIAQGINEAHQQTKYVTTVVENMCGQGHTIGGKFEELAAIIDQVEDKARIGICVDTCHAFAAGFDLTTDGGYEDMWRRFDEIVGFRYLKAMHINDSKGGLGCHLDRHELIGKGKLGKSSFYRIMNDKRLRNIPLILETPDPDAWEREIKLLYSMQA